MANIDAQLYAATLSENQLQATQKNLAHQPNFAQALLITPEFPQQYAAHFDQIILCYVLMYIPSSERITFFKNLHRLLKPNGQLIIVNEPVTEEPKPNMLCPNCSAAFAAIGPAAITTHETVHPFAQSAGFTLVKKRTFRTYAPCENRWQQMLSIVWNALTPKPFTDLLWVYQT
jgi:cyclopropane fatty-acyl-phospholipid synthase-like methyltransferase